MEPKTQPYSHCVITSSCKTDTAESLLQARWIIKINIKPSSQQGCRIFYPLPEFTYRWNRCPSAGNKQQPLAFHLMKQWRTASNVFGLFEVMEDELKENYSFCSWAKLPSPWHSTANPLRLSNTSGNEESKDIGKLSTAHAPNCLGSKPVPA